MSTYNGSVTCEHVVERIEDWKTRLDELFRRIELWTSELEGSEVVRTRLPQAREELMRKFHVEPREIPALAVRTGDRRLSFVPLGLWVIGANGRVNITTNRRSYILVDLAEVPGDPADWVILDSGRRGSRTPLSRETFRRLVRDEDPFA